MEMVNKIPSQTSLPTYEHSTRTKIITYKAGEDNRTFQILQILRHIVLRTGIHRDGIEGRDCGNGMNLVNKMNNEWEEILHVFILQIRLFCGGRTPTTNLSFVTLRLMHILAN